MKNQHTYHEVYAKNTEEAIVRVYRPELSGEERARRMRELHRAAEDLLKEVIKLERTR